METFDILITYKNGITILRLRKVKWFANSDKLFKWSMDGYNWDNMPREKIKTIKISCI